jgi:predicted nucleotidyltransferase
MRGAVHPSRQLFTQSSSGRGTIASMHLEGALLRGKPRKVVSVHTMTEPISLVRIPDISLIPGLLEVVTQIVRQFHPQKIILFGSHAAGQAERDSDVDLLVVMETEDHPLHMAARIAAAVDHPVPLDIIVVRPSQLARAVREGSIFETDVLRRGIVLYEAADTRMA